MKPYRRTMTIAAILLFAAAGGAWAQDLSTEAGAPEGALSLQWRQVLDYGGWVLYVIGALSVFALANILTLFVTLRTAAVVPRSLVRDVVAKVRDGALPDARALCEDRPGPFAAVALATLDYVASTPNAEPGMVKDLLVGEGTRQATRLQGSTQWLVDIAAVAPMVGLLGTVLGMLMAFSAVAGDVAAAKPVLLAQGVAHALITTIAGLFVAIPASLFYAWFRRCANRLTAQLEIASHELLSALLTLRTR